MMLFKIGNFNNFFFNERYSKKFRVCQFQKETGDSELKYRKEETFLEFAGRNRESPEQT